MYKILVSEKPKHCEQCPLKNSETRECGTVRACKSDSAGMNWRKEPDSRCKIKKCRVLFRG